VFTLAAGRFSPPDSDREILVVIRAPAHRWTHLPQGDQRVAAINALVEQARDLLNDAITGWEEDADGASGDLVVLAHELHENGFLYPVDQPKGKWGAETATTCIGPFPRHRPVS